MSVTLVHLVRKANGPEPLRAFLEAYRATTSPLDHGLVLACKGFEDRVDLARHESLWSGLEPRILMLPDTGFDLGSYRRAAEEIRTSYVCFVNSFSRPLVTGWLPLLHAAARTEGVGIAGATGSLEGIPGCPFPNPHIRTNAFCMKRELFLELTQGDTSTKEAVCLLEAGPSSITRQVMDRGLRAVVADSLGSTYDIEQSRHLGTFRWGEQRNLLVADNRTDDYQTADAERRAWLQRLAWGENE